MTPPSCTRGRAAWMVLFVAALTGCPGGSGPTVPAPDAGAKDAAGLEGSVDSAAVDDARDGSTGMDATPDNGSLEDVGEPHGPPPDGARECMQHRDCEGNPRDLVCDAARGVCVQCAVAEDTCPSGTRCDAGRCVPGCRTDGDCPGVTRCDLATRRCRGCRGDGECAGGQACCAGLCLDTQADPRNCGACGRACPAGQPCCNSACAATAEDPRNCGGCGNACSVANGAAACVGSRCRVASCAAGFGDCDVDPATGCETPVTADPANCGRCGGRCAVGPNATAICAAGACSVVCNTGFGDCDRGASNGCEVDLRSTTAHCGACGRACPAGPNATARCATSACTARCTEGFGDCDGDPANGCEVNLAASPSHCGGCGTACAAPNAAPACRAGACAVGACNAGFGDCNAVAADGCEVDVRADNTNCGRCGNRCPAGQVCAAGACAMTCSAGLTLCGGICVDVSSSVSSCGRCGNACPAASNALVTCAAGACGLACARFFGDCDGALGCEASLLSDPAHCGRCGNRCPARANASPRCALGACDLTCAAGFADCNGSDLDGCEVATATDARSCGACGVVCAVPNATSTCRAGACAVGTCNAGFGDCNALASDGCETGTSANPSHCGRCGNRCASGQVCSAGTCALLCARPRTACAGACVDLQTDPSNCSACGRACLRGQVCAAGVCSTPPPSNDRCAGATELNLAAGSSLTVGATTVAATHDLDAPCLGAGLGDVWFRFTLSRRELVYADTLASPGFNSKLFFASSCSAALTTRTAGDLVCDNIGGIDCAVSRGSQVYSLLPAGTYYLVLTVQSGAAGTATLNVQHLPAGNGDVLPLAPGSSTPSGSTSGTSGTTGTCGGSGPEDAFWWVTCPATASGTLTASTCLRASWDTVLYVRNGNGVGDACNNDAPVGPPPFGSLCGERSSLSATIPAGAGLHTLILDGFAGASGTYTLAVSRP